MKTFRGKKLQASVVGEENSVLLILLFPVIVNACGSQRLGDIFSGIKFWYDVFIQYSSICE